MGHSLRSWRESTARMTAGDHIQRLAGPMQIGFLHLTSPGLRTQLLTNQRLITLGLTIDNRQAGLVVGQLDWPYRQRATGIIMSLCVDSAFRGRGYGIRLVQAMEAEMARAGMTRLHARWIDDVESSVAVSRLLEKRGWDAPAPDCMLCRSDLKLFTDPFIRTVRFRVEPPYTHATWDTLTPDDHETIRELVRNHHIGPGYDPHFESHLIEPTLSLALKHGGEVVGWQINHLVQPDTIRYTKTWIPDRLRSQGLRSSGIGFRLAMETVRLCRAASKRVPKSIMLFDWHNARMQHFFERRLRHGLTSWSPIMESGVLLGDGVGHG